MHFTGSVCFRMLCNCHIYRTPGKPFFWGGFGVARKRCSNIAQVHLQQLPLPSQICYGTLELKKQTNHQLKSGGFFSLEQICCWKWKNLNRSPEVLLCHYALFMDSELQRKHLSAPLELGKSVRNFSHGVLDDCVDFFFQSAT